MKIALNATCISSRPAGARQRFLGIYGELMRQLPDDEFFLYEPADCRVGKWFDRHENVHVIPTPLNSESRWQKSLRGGAWWPREHRRLRPDVYEAFHLPAFASPVGETFLTIHDIRRFNSKGYARESHLYAHLLKQAIGKAHWVITVSETMRDEICERFPDARVVVVYNGVDLEKSVQRDRKQLAGVSPERPLPQEYLLAVGHLEGRKNYLNLLESIAVLHRTSIGVPLVIVGNDSGLRGEMEERIRALGLVSCVWLLGGLSDAALDQLYLHTRMFVFPSVYEGFGIPILEAMAAGTPMALSDIPVFREIAGDAAEYFNPESPEDMAKTIGNLLGSQALQTSLSSAGKVRVKQFGFPQAALRLSELYASVR